VEKTNKKATYYFILRKAITFPVFLLGFVSDHIVLKLYSSKSFSGTKELKQQQNKSKNSKMQPFYRKSPRSFPH